MPKHKVCSQIVNPDNIPLTGQSWPLELPYFQGAKHIEEWVLEVVILRLSGVDYFAKHVFKQTESVSFQNKLLSGTQFGNV